MLTVAVIADFLARFAPPRLAEEWDNVGLLVGRGDQPVRRLMTCLTLTRESVAEAVAEQVDLVVSHHPLPLKPLRRLTDETPEGRLLLDLMGAKVAVYSPHTAFDSAGRGINQCLAEGIGLQAIQPLTADNEEPAVGTGRVGRLAEGMILTELAAQVGEFLNIRHVQFVGAKDRRVQTVAVACGSAGGMLNDARRRGCDCFVTGETRFHTCLEGEAIGIALILAGHFATERFAVEQLVDVLAAEFPDAQIWASRRERDPIEWLSPSCPPT